MSYTRRRRRSPAWAVLAVCTFCHFVAATVATDESPASASGSAGYGRDLHFALCKGYRQASFEAADSGFTVTTRMACWKECAQHPTCRSSGVCVQGEGDDVMTCFLSSEATSHCSHLARDSQCTTARMMDRCQNGGSLNKFTMTCDCSAGWSGLLCETELTTVSQTTEATSASSTTLQTTVKSTTKSTLPPTTTTASSTTALTLPALCFTGNTECSPEKKFIRMAPDGTVYCCPPYANSYFHICSPECKGDCWCM